MVNRNTLTETEEQLVSRFIGGLRLQIQNSLLQFDPVTVSEAHQRALLIEQQLSRSTSSSWTSATSRARLGPPADTTPLRHSEQSKTPEAPEGGGTLKMTRPATFRCFGYGEQDHRQSACPHQSRRGLLTNDDPIFDAEDTTEEHEDLVERVHGDSGPLLLLRRNYLCPRGMGESWLRTNIFRSSCTIRGKVRCLVIDSGSCTNVVSEEAVSKLALVTEPHPNPYKLVWLNTSTELRISKQCRVPFPWVRLTTT